ncbi:MAG: glycoside hydrolase family 3 C-terminal domain-containing protein [Prevotella sp.]|nr:glycoside hydrolase family 3 C-terminal domain-containing protein [Prevotella sp.]
MKKLFFLTSLIMMTMAANSQVYLDPQAPVEERVKDALSRMTTHEKIKVLHAQSKFTSAGVPRLGIRQLNMDDGPHGVREELEWNTWNPANWTNDAIVAFPSLTCLAATWNRDMSRLYGHSVSEEFAFRGKDIMLGPGVNIARTPMNGRAFEYMGEDPLLAGEMVVPYIQAAQANGVACCLKHFVLNDQETDRFGVNVNVSERAMREIYLSPFERAVKKAHVWSIMGSYNYWQNIHCCQNDLLLNGILKKEWQWDGALVSDWGGTTDTREAVLGGLDIEMGTYTDGKTRESEFGYDDYYLGNKFEKLINSGEIPMSVLDEKVSRVLRIIFRTAMNPNKIIGNQCSEAHYDACRQIGEEGIVLLKNKAQPRQRGGEQKYTLPLNLSKYKNILIVGENATRSLTKGGGSSELKTLRDISPLDGLRSQFSTLNSQLSIDYAQGYSSGRALYDKVDKFNTEENARLKAEALDKAKDADLIIFIGGFNKNHRQDCENGDRENYDLSFGQNELISELADIASSNKEKKSSIIVVTFGGNAYAMPWLDKVSALLHCWYLGSESGKALANVLTGLVNPSGKLPITIAKRYEDYPYVKYDKEAYPGISQEKQKGKPNSQVYYKEDVFVGYRGFEKDKTQPLFPFGFGLSYTSFDYGKPTVTLNGDNICVSVTITNTGKRTGKETVQVYVSAPKNKQIEKPAKELKSFGKTRLLQPGESETLYIVIPRSELASWDEATHQWLVDSGTYTVMIGASCTDIRGKQKITL